MYTTKLIKHKEENRIAVYFENKAELIARFKKLKGAKWSATLKLWHLPNTEEYRKKFKVEKSRKQEKPLSTEAHRQTEKFVQWLRSKRYSESSIKHITMPYGSFCNSFRIKR